VNIKRAIEIIVLSNFKQEKYKLFSHRLSIMATIIFCSTLTTCQPDTAPNTPDQTVTATTAINRKKNNALIKNKNTYLLKIFFSAFSLNSKE